MIRLLIVLLLLSCTVYSQRRPHFSSYRTAVGFVGDYGNYDNFLGISGKHFLTRQSAIQADLGFGGQLVSLKVFYQYQHPFTPSSALQWYVGAGPAITFGYVDPIFAVGPVAGLDTRLGGLPIRLFADWRPQLVLDQFSEWQGTRFGLGLRYAW